MPSSRKLLHTDGFADSGSDSESEILPVTTSSVTRIALSSTRDDNQRKLQTPKPFVLSIKDLLFESPNHNQVHQSQTTPTAANLPSRAADEQISTPSTTTNERRRLTINLYNLLKNKYNLDKW